MKNKFGFSIKDSDTESLKVVNKLYDHANKHGLNFSFIVLQALKEIAPKLIGDKNE